MPKHTFPVALLLALLCIGGCATPRPAIDRIATAHGFNHFDKIATVAFTFNVRRPGSESSRSWFWNTRTDEVTLTFTDSAGVRQTETFTRGDTSAPGDAKFVNDSFWLLLPLHLKWSNANVQVQNHGPSAGRPRVTVVYPSEGGGYTPGDRYELELDGDDRIVWWAFHRGGAADATLTTTWEDYHRVGPLLLSLKRVGTGGFTLWFSEVNVTKR